MELPKTLEDVVSQFKRLPGVGEKSALRLALYMIDWNHSDIGEFGSSIENLKSIKKCSSCNSLSDLDLCKICSSPSRKGHPFLCVVESMMDLFAIENSGEFEGNYFVLGGVLNPLKGTGPDDIGVPALCKKVINNEVENVILAVNPSIEGDATCSYINDVLPENVSVDRIGFGVPIGGSLEYLDSLTISQALKNRKSL